MDQGLQEEEEHQVPSERMNLAVESHRSMREPEGFQQTADILLQDLLLLTDGDLPSQKEGKELRHENPLVKVFGLLIKVDLRMIR